MKNTAFIINTSRGQIIDQRALIKALRSRWIAGAGLDVYEKEPIFSSNALLRMNNVMILPHISNTTYQETHSKIAKIHCRKYPQYIKWYRTIIPCKSSDVKKTMINILE